MLTSAGRRHSIRSPGGLVPPLALTAPTFAGIPVRGQLLTGTAGTYSGIPAPDLTYQWQRDGGDIAGATAITYTLVAADDASSITLIETATNGAGSTSQTTAAAITAPAFLTDDTDAWHHAGLGVTDASLEVTDWANQGNGGVSYDTTQATGTVRPDLVANDVNFNNRATIHYDGGDALNTPANGAWEFADGTSAVSAALFRQDAGNGLKGLVTTSATGAGGLQLNTRLDASPTSIVRDGTVLLSDTTGSATSVSTVSTRAWVLTGATTPTNDSLESFLDGVGSGSPATDDLGAVAPATDREMILGASGTTGTSGLIGNLAEAFYIKRVLTATEDADLTSYWNDYYGTSFASGVTL